MSLTMLQALESIPCKYDRLAVLLQTVQQGQQAANDTCNLQNLQLKLAADSHQDAIIRRACLTHLDPATIGPDAKQAIAVAVQVLHTRSWDWELAAAALKVLGSCMPALSAADADWVWQILSSFCGHHHARVREVAVQAVLQGPDTVSASKLEAVLAAISPLLLDAFEKVRLASLNTLASLAQQLQKLLEPVMLRESDPAQGQLAGSGTKASGSREEARLLQLLNQAFQLLCSCLLDISPRVRANALVSMQGLHSVSKEVKQQALSKKSTMSIPNAAADESTEPALDPAGSGLQQGISGTGPSGLPLMDAAVGAFVHGAEDERFEVRLATLRLLLDLSQHDMAVGEQAFDILADMLRDPYAEVRDAAAQGLVQLARSCTVAFPQVPNILAGLQEPSALVRDAIFQCLQEGNLSGPGVLKAVLQGVVAAVAQHPEFMTDVANVIRAVSARYPKQLKSAASKMFKLDKVHRNSPPDVLAVILAVHISHSGATSTGTGEGSNLEEGAQQLEGVTGPARYLPTWIPQDTGCELLKWIVHKNSIWIPDEVVRECRDYWSGLEPGKHPSAASLQSPPPLSSKSPATPLSLPALDITNVLLGTQPWDPAVAALLLPQPSRPPDQGAAPGSPVQQHCMDPVVFGKALDAWLRQDISIRGSVEGLRKLQEAEKLLLALPIIEDTLLSAQALYLRLYLHAVGSITLLQKILTGSFLQQPATAAACKPPGGGDAGRKNHPTTNVEERDDFWGEYGLTFASLWDSSIQDVSNLCAKLCAISCLLQQFFTTSNPQHARNCTVTKWLLGAAKALQALSSVPSAENPAAAARGQTPDHSQSRPFNQAGQSQPFSQARGQSQPFSQARGQSQPFSQARGQSQPLSQARGQSEPFSKAEVQPIDHNRIAPMDQHGIGRPNLAAAGATHRYVSRPSKQAVIGGSNQAGNQPIQDGSLGTDQSGAITARDIQLVIRAVQGVIRMFPSRTGSATEHSTPWTNMELDSGVGTHAQPPATQREHVLSNTQSESGVCEVTAVEEAIQLLTELNSRVAENTQGGVRLRNGLVVPDFVLTSAPAAVQSLCAEQAVSVDSQRNLNPAISCKAKGGRSCMGQTIIGMSLSSDQMPGHHVAAVGESESASHVKAVPSTSGTELQLQVGESENASHVKAVLSTSGTEPQLQAVGNNPRSLNTAPSSVLRNTDCRSSLQAARSLLHAVWLYAVGLLSVQDVLPDLTRAYFTLKVTRPVNASQTHHQQGSMARHMGTGSVDQPFMHVAGLPVWLQAKGWVCSLPSVNGLDVRWSVRSGAPHHRQPTGTSKGERAGEAHSRFGMQVRTPLELRHVKRRQGGCVVSNARLVTGVSSHQHALNLSEREHLAVQGGLQPGNQGGGSSASLSVSHSVLGSDTGADQPRNMVGSRQQQGEVARWEFVLQEEVPTPPGGGLCTVTAGLVWHHRKCQVLLAPLVQLVLLGT